MIGGRRGTGQPGAPGGRAAPGFGPEAALLTVVLLWASTFVVTKDAFDRITPLAFTFARFAIMLALAFAVLAIRGRGAARARYWRVRRADLPLFGAAGLTGYVLYQLGFVLGLERTSPFSSSLLIAMVPLFTVLILLLGGERTPARGWAGLALAVIGVAVFLADKRGSGEEGSLSGDALSLGAAVAFASYGVVNRPLTKRYPPETYTAYTLVGGAVPLLAISAPAAAAQDWGRLGVGGWVAVVYMAILPVYVAYMLWNWAIARRGVAAATRFSLLVPVASGALSALVFSEAFGPVKLLGAAIVLLGLAIARRRGDVARSEAAKASATKGTVEGPE